jgi:hypothetical protein
LSQATAAYVNAAYKTFEMYLAAFLLASGHVLQRIEGDYRRAFVFPPDAKGDADAFYQGATVSALLYAHALRDLKSRLHAA